MPVPYHIDTIKAEVGKTGDLKAAFIKFKELNPAQVEGVARLGLSPDQVRSPNFGYHTLNAIEAE
jgi:hypothetical protein